MKSCAKCKEVKSPEMFRKNSRMLTGLDSYCLSCISKSRSKRRQEIKSLPKPVIFKKRCTRCKETKEVCNFNFENGNKDGFSGICKPCRSEKHKEHRARNIDAYRESVRNANRKMAMNPSFIVHKRVSARVREWLGTKRGGKRTFDLLGYSVEELKAHLERQFVKGMSWENRGDWHIDHIVPLSSFTQDQVRQAWALSNLRPLWAKQNLTKHKKMEFLL